MTSTFSFAPRHREPLVRRVLADLDTPVSAYLKLADAPYSYLFESVHGGETWGRYSFIGLPCEERIVVRGNEISRFIGEDCTEQLTVDDPLEWVDALQQSFVVSEHPELPRFSGGLVGYFGHDTVRFIEPRLRDSIPPDEIGNPDIMLLLSEEVLVFDNLAGCIYIVVHHDPQVADDAQRAEQRLEQIAQQLRGPRPERAEPAPVAELSEADFVSGFTQEGFESAVQTCREYIRNGDAMQIVISQRMTVPFTSDPLALYRALRTLNPSPYLYFMNLGELHIVGSSPEILVRFDPAQGGIGGGEVTVRPIAGTRPRGATVEEDVAFEEDLLADPKELAEHLMLIDLGRNDVGRISEVGEVELTDKMIVERYSHVMHIVSNVIGKVRPGVSAIDVLRATFPAGTLSGAPKVRALEIIDELEPVKRGVYGGAVGYLAFNGGMDTAIAIRTAVIRDGQLHVQAGAGIVHDSVPTSEWDETMNKGRAVFRAVAMAQRGLHQVAASASSSDSSSASSSTQEQE